METNNLTLKTKDFNDLQDFVVHLFVVTIESKDLLANPTNPSSKPFDIPIYLGC